MANIAETNRRTVRGPVTRSIAPQRRTGDRVVIEHDEGAEIHQIRVLRSMTPEQRLLQAFELSERMRLLFAEGLRRRFPGLSEDRFRSLLRARLDACHNRNY